MPLLSGLNFSGCENLSSLGECSGLPKLYSLHIPTSEMLLTFPEGTSVSRLYMDQFSNWDHLRNIRPNLITCENAKGLKKIGNASGISRLLLSNASDLESAAGLAKANMLRSLRIEGANKLQSIPSIAHLKITNLALVGDHIECKNWREGFQDNVNQPTSTLSDAPTLIGILALGGKLADDFLAKKKDVKWLWSFEINNAKSLTHLEQLSFVDPVYILRIVDCKQLKSIRSLAENLIRFQELWLEGCVEIQDLQLLHQCDWLKTITIAGDFRSSQFEAIRFPSNIETLRFERCTGLEEIGVQLAETYSIKTLEIVKCAELSRLKLPRHLRVEQIEVLDCPNIDDADFEGYPVKFKSE